MEYTLINNTKVSSLFVKEDYFPIIIRFSTEELNNHFLEFNYGETDMFELSVHPNTKKIKQFTLTLCNHYVFKDDLINVPPFNECDLLISGPNKIECSMFTTIVYNNGVKIETSKDAASKHIKCGQLIFSFTSSDELTAIYIIDLSSDEIQHVKSELLV